MLVVILAGLLLGGALAHFFGTKAPQKSPSDAVAVVTAPPVMASPEANAPTPLPTFTPVPSPTPLPSLTPLASPTPLATATPFASASPSASATAAARSSATPLAYVTHAPVRATIAPHPVQPRPKRTRRPLPAVSHVAMNVTPAPSKSMPSIGDQASTVVRSYLSAMTQGDKEAASAYLANGEPTESFLNPSTAVESVRSEALGGSRYRVTADMRSSGTEYYETFTVEPGPGGLQITDHYWIKPQ